MAPVATSFTTNPNVPTLVLVLLLLIDKPPLTGLVYDLLGIDAGPAF